MRGKRSSIVYITKMMGLLFLLVYAIGLAGKPNTVQAKVKSFKAQVQYNSKSKVTLKWKKTKAKKIIVYRAAASKAIKKPRYKKYKTLKGAATKFTDKKVKMMKYYYYRISGLNARGKKLYQQDLTVIMQPQGIKGAEGGYSEEDYHAKYYVQLGKGLTPTGIVVYKRDDTVNQNSFKKLGTFKTRDADGDVVFEDTAVVRYHIYSYKIRSFLKAGKKTYYGKEKIIRLRAGSTKNSLQKFKVSMEQPYNKKDGTIVIRVENFKDSTVLRLFDYAMMAGYERAAVVRFSTTNEKYKSENKRFPRAYFKLIGSSSSCSSFTKFSKDIYLEPGQTVYLQLERDVDNDSSETEELGEWIYDTGLYLYYSYEDDSLLFSDEWDEGSAGYIFSADFDSGTGDVKIWLETEYGNFDDYDEDYDEE